MATLGVWICSSRLMASCLGTCTANTRVSRAFGEGSSCHAQALEGDLTSLLSTLRLDLKRKFAWNQDGIQPRRKHPSAQAVVFPLH
eukprot:3966464-Amphidinium_carterae.1